jgi:hypothetical protein
MLRKSLAHIKTMLEALWSNCSSKSWRPHLSSEEQNTELVMVEQCVMSAITHYWKSTFVSEQVTS